jgi:hypothetical protein
MAHEPPYMQMLVKLRFRQRTGRQKIFLGRGTMCLSPKSYEMYSLLAGNLDEEKL